MNLPGRNTIRSVVLVGLLSAVAVLPQTNSAAQTTTKLTSCLDTFGGLFGDPNGMVRTVVLNAELATLNENPPVTGRDASGEATVAIRLERASATDPKPMKAILMVNIDAATVQNETITMAHIHRGEIGVNGPIVVGFNLPGSTITTAGQRANLDTQFEVTDAATLDVLQKIIASPGSYYVNVHTESNPGGHIRGQLTESPLAAARRAQECAAETNRVVTQDLRDVKRLIILLAAKENIISPQERDDLLKSLQ